MAKINSIINELEAAAPQVLDDKVDAMIDAVSNHERVFVYGTGRSGLMLKAFAMRLMQLGLTAYVVGETTTPSVKRGDLLVIASASGETDTVVSAVSKAVKGGVDVAAITGNHESSVSRLVKPLVTIDSSTKFSTSSASAQPLGSLFEQMLLLYFDSIALKMSQAGAPRFCSGSSPKKK
ncbi:MAG: SIS domain-containing protein [Selenomonadaceae bacterium]|nr:SIS domain-containing protein [Selenomonadaceae bacterium]